MGAPAQVIGFYPTPGSELLGRYRIDEEIGRGGFSVVYGASDLMLGTDVAIKLLVPPPATAHVARERMRREVQAVRGISHPNIVALYDFLEDGMWSFIVMERIVGKNLAGIVTVGGVLPFVDVINIGKGIASALSAAHARGILHRDVKPQNVLLDRGGVPKLVDFGAARLDGQTVTRTGALVGTLQYTAPELLAGERGDARADVYALGLTLYYALTQRLPAGASPHSAPAANAEGHRPSEHRAHVPEWLDDVIARATAADPAARFATAAGLEDALTRGTRYDAPELDVNRCVVCDAPEPFGLSICPACGGSADGAGDTLVFVKPEGSRDERRRIGERLEPLLDGRTHDAERGLVAGGHRALIKIPKAAADTVVRRLAARGIPARVASARTSWARLPLPFYALLTSTVVVGGLAGLTSAPLLAYASPLVAVLLLFTAQYQAAKPAVRNRERQPAFGRDLDTLVTTTFAALPRGAARSLLASVVRAAESVERLLHQTAAPGIAEGDLEDLVRRACDAAVRLSDLDESLRQYEENTELADGTASAWMDQWVTAERMRDGLTHKLLESVTLLNRLRAHALAGDDARDRLAALVAEINGRIEAWEDVS